MTKKERITYAEDILQKELLPHIGLGSDAQTKKAYFIGYMVHRLLLASAILSWQVGCFAGDTPTDARNPPMPATQIAEFDPDPTPAGPSLDEQFLRVAQDVPGFAGVGIGEDGVLEIRLVDTTDGSRARAVVAQVFAGARSIEGRTSRVVRVRYSFEQLVNWRSALYRAGLPRGTRQIDADERRNVVFVGTSDAQVALAVREIARSLDIPDDAMLIAPVGEVRPLADSLGKYLRPVTGGLIIGLWMSPSSVNYCSMGFKAKKTGTTRYLLTNSHCTATFGSVNADSVGQPNGSDWLGNETQDPAFSSTNCTGGYTCRWSDAAMIQCNSNSTCSSYTLARTTFEYTGSNWSTGSGSLELANDYWYVVGALSSGSLVYGASVSRVGFSTGWTGGTIQKTCYDYVDYPASGKILKCQYTSLAVVRSGDSGSPVFQYESATGKAWLGGIIWGYEYDAGYQSIFSPIDGIKTDLGSMTVTMPARHRSVDCGLDPGLRLQWKPLRSGARAQAFRV